MSAPFTILPRVFIACAPQDFKYAELIAAKARGDRMLLTFDGFADGRPSELSWQLECRRRIRAARAVVVLISPHTSSSARALWQAQCARTEGVPVVGITVTFDDDAERARGAPVGTDSLLGWKWKTIAATLTRLAASPSKAPVRPVTPEEAAGRQAVAAALDIPRRVPQTA